MPTTTSAGILLYRRAISTPAPTAPPLEFLLIHPGGPYWASQDLGAWSIPKGEPSNGEDLLAAAIREFHEETGFTVAPRPSLIQKRDGVTPPPPPAPIPLTPVRTRGGKTIHAWAIEGNPDLTTFHSNTFTTEWPPKSGRHGTFPEADQVRFFPSDQVHKYIHPAQAPFIIQLERRLAAPNRGPTGRED